jgi:hypothetical protein
LGTGQEGDERALNAFIEEVKIRKIVPALIQDALPKFWCIYVEYEEDVQELQSNEESKTISGSRTLENIRRRYPRAYEKWTEEDDVRLRIEYGKGSGIQPLSEMFQRQPGSVRSRLRKLGILK